MATYRQQASTRMPFLHRSMMMPAVNTDTVDLLPYGACSIVGMEDAIGVNEPVLKVERPSALGGSVAFNGPAKMTPGKRGHVQVGEIAIARIEHLLDVDGVDIFNPPYFAKQSSRVLTTGGGNIPGSAGGAIGAFRLLGLLEHPVEGNRRWAHGLVKRISECWIQRYSIQVLGAPLTGSFVLAIYYWDQVDHDEVVVDINDTAETIQEALESLPRIGVGNVTVENGPLPWHSLYVTIGDTPETITDIVPDGLNLAGGTRPMVVIDRVGC